MPQANAVAPLTRAANLALIFQEALTVTVRLRSNRQAVNDADSFRRHVREALKNAAQEARDSGGYSTDDIKLATFAVAAFLDESVLSLQNPLFANWPRMSLQQELFRTHMAGEIFFQNLESLLGKPDSQDLADLLEVHYLCLLLGYRGKYSQGGTGELQSTMRATAEKIRRIRGPLTGLSPSWELKAGAMVAPKDTLTKTLAIVAAGAGSVHWVQAFARFGGEPDRGADEPGEELAWRRGGFAAQGESGAGSVGRELFFFAKPRPRISVVDWGRELGARSVQSARQEVTDRVAGHIG
jgi:type VI secretion system protein ImpK